MTITFDQLKIDFDQLKMETAALQAKPIETDVTVSREIFARLERLPEDSEVRAFLRLHPMSVHTLAVHVDKTLGENDWHFGRPGER